MTAADLDEPDTTAQIQGKPRTGLHARENLLETLRQAEDERAKAMAGALENGSDWGLDTSRRSSPARPR